MVSNLRDRRYKKAWLDQDLEIHLVKAKGKHNSSQVLKGTNVGLMTLLASLMYTLITNNVTNEEKLRALVDTVIDSIKKGEPIHEFE